MSESIKGILKKVNAIKNDHVRIKLRNRWDEDFDFYRLKPYNAGSGYYSYTSNAPRALAERVMAIMISAKLKARCPLDQLTDVERVYASTHER